MFKYIVCDRLAVTTDIPAFVFTTCWEAVYTDCSFSPLATSKKLTSNVMQNKRCSVLRFFSLVSSYFVLPQNETRAPIKTPAWEANLYVSIFSSYGGSASRTLRYKHYKHNYWLHILGWRIPFVIPRTSDVI